MPDAAQRRAELAAFLRKRRSELDRSEFGLPPVARSRTSGLRREEVAYQAAVSVTWYTWLEQGRDINPSRQVLDALAATLRLSAAEHDYMLGLAGQLPPDRSAEGVTPGPSAPAHLQQLLEALMPSPAFVLTQDWHIAAWNDGYRVLYPEVTEVRPEDRNLLWVVFTDSSLRELLPDWHETSRRFLAEYRAEAGGRLDQPYHRDLVRRLTARSGDFASAWADHEIERFATRERHFVHPTAGLLVFEQLRLEPSDHPGLHVVVYLAHDHPTTSQRMSELVRDLGD